MLPRQLAMSVIIKESDARKDNSWKRPLRLRRNEHPRQALYIRNFTLRKMFQPFSVLSFYADFHKKIGWKVCFSNLSNPSAWVGNRLRRKVRSQFAEDLIGDGKRWLTVDALKGARGWTLLKGLKFKPFSQFCTDFQQVSKEGWKVEGFFGELKFVYIEEKTRRLGAGNRGSALRDRVGGKH